jgi:hypothetical protein
MRRGEDLSGLAIREDVSIIAGFGREIIPQ